MKYIAYLILIITIGFNLWLNYPESKILADPNDNVFQYSLVYRTNWIWQNYGCPLSLSCLPNLIDHNVTTWAEGYPLPFYYPHIPQIAIVASYNLFIKPVSSLFALPFSLYAYYNWTRYLLLVFFPLPVFLALRIVGFAPILAALGAFFASHFSTDGLYGIDPPSFLWRGYGLTSQLYAIFFLPLGLAFTFHAMRAEHKTRDGIWAALFLTLTTAGHLGIGIIGLLSTLPFLLLDFNIKHIISRFKKLFLILTSSFLILSYWIIPILLNNNYHIISFWDPIWKFNSYGWYEVVRQFFQGEIFDWQRSFPIITAIVIIGFFIQLLNIRLFPFALLFAFWMLMYFGRTTWGGLMDLIPGMKDFHQHRFIVGVHMAALFLIPAGIAYIFDLLQKISDFVFLTTNSKFKIQNSKLQFKIKNWFNILLLSAGGLSEGSQKALHLVSENKDYGAERLDFAMQLKRNFGIREGQDPQIKVVQNIIFYILTLTFVSIVAYFTVQKTIQYAELNNRWIGEANNAYRYDEKNFQNLASYLSTLPSARLYAGRPGNWGHDFRLGSTQIYMLFGVNGFDMSQFLPETWSPLSENEQNFDERVAEDYDLLNLKYIVADKNHDFTPSAKLDKKFGPFELYQVPTTGWFDVVSSPMFVKTDKTNYINLVQLWHRSYARRWKMYPLISVEKNPVIPQGMQRIITMTDEVSYSDNQLPTTNYQLPTKNIFSDYPFVFPEATVSGKIRNEAINRQTYSATVEIPNNCKDCMIMFKMSYHPDWEVKVDGQKVAKYAVFPFYLATPATPGTHNVEFTYQPNSLKVILLLLEILIIGALFIFLFIFKRKSHRIKYTS